MEGLNQVKYGKLTLCSSCNDSYINTLRTHVHHHLLFNPYFHLYVPYPSSQEYLILFIIKVHKYSIRCTYLIFTVLAISTYLHIE